MSYIIYDTFNILCYISFTYLLMNINLYYIEEIDYVKYEI